MEKHLWEIISVIILFMSCDRNNDSSENESLIFSCHRSGGWSGLNENLKITSKTMQYSISFRDLQTLELTSYENQVQTPDELWSNLIKSFDLVTFIKIQDGDCRACVDGIDVKFSVIKDGKDYTFSNGEDSEYYKVMKIFFDAILMQSDTLNIYFR